MRGGVGLSESDQSSVAGREAAAAAMRQAGGPAALAVVFCSHTHDLDALAAAVQAEVGSAPVVGATSAGLLVGDGTAAGRFVSSPSHVGVLVLSGDEVEVGAAVVEGLTAGGAEIGRAVTRTARAALPPQEAGSIPRQGDRSTVLLLSDGLAGDQQEIVRGVHSVAGARVPVVGGAAADGYSLAGPSVLFGDRAYRDAVVAVWLRSRAPLAIASAHGWAPAGLPALVTASHGNTVLEIAGRPAPDFYGEQLDQLGEQRVGERLYELTVRHPLGLVQSDGSHLIRSVLGSSRRGLLLSAGAPEGSSVQVMAGNPDSLLQGAADLGDALRSPSVIPGGTPGAALFFSCAARRLSLGDRIAEEASRLVDDTRPGLGVYTYGEFHRSTSAQGFHNATVVGIAL